MATFDELLTLAWPAEFEVVYVDGTRERLLRGDGVQLTPADDSPDDCAALHAQLPQKHSRNQKQYGRYLRLNELSAIYSVEGIRLWPT